MEKGKENRQIGTGCLLQHRMELAVKRVESVSDRMQCIVLTGLRFNVVIYNVQAINGEKSDD
jgi:hypothetical protein